MCHTIGGLNDIRERVAGRTTDGIAAIIAHAHEMIPFMPPFSGRREEGQVMAQFLHDLASGAIELNATSRFVPERKGESHE